MNKSLSINSKSNIYSLSSSMILKLKKESSNDEDIFEQLCIESITRKWLKAHRIPSWRNPATPIKDTLNQSNGRYSILLSDGSRFLVKPFSKVILSLDMLASAKCFGVLVIKFNKTDNTGQVMNCILIRNVCKTLSNYSTEIKDLESCSTFLHYLKVPRNYISTLILFSIKLLIIGEPGAPEKGANGVIPFNQTKSGPQEAQNG